MTSPPMDTTDTAPVRTRLSWRRTVLSAAAVTLLVARLAAHDGFAPPDLALGGLTLLSPVGIALLGRYRLRTVDGRPATPRWVPVATAACVAWFAVLGAALAVLR